MSNEARRLGVGLSVICFLLWPMAGRAASASPAFGRQVQPAPAEDFRELPAPGKKCPIDDRHYFTYEFTETPKMGIAILRVRIFDSSRTQTSAFAVTGRYDMPAMAGAHDSGDQDFKLNKKMDYLLPVNIAMPGEWEIRLTFRREGAVVFRGRFRFDV